MKEIQLVYMQFTWNYELLAFIMLWGERYNSMVEFLLMVQWVVRSISLGGPIELFFFQANAPQLEP